MERVKEEMVAALEGWHRKLDENIEAALGRMCSASTVEELHKEKRELLLTVLGTLPLGFRSCAYCIQSSLECGSCEYATTHGVCMESGSDFREILKSLHHLFKLIEKTY